MKTNFFSRFNNFDEVVFENRNKLYGAYDLRATYDERLTLSAMATVSFFMLLFSVLYFSPGRQQVPDIQQIISCPGGGEIELERPPIILVDPPRMFPLPAESAEVTPNIVKHDVQESQQVKPNADLSGSGQGETGQGGTLNGTGTDHVVGDFTFEEKIPIPAPEPVDYTLFYDVPPRFDAYESYLQSHIKYPEIAVANKIQGTIFIMELV